MLDDQGWLKEAGQRCIQDIWLFLLQPPFSLVSEFHVKDEDTVKNLASRLSGILTVTLILALNVTSKPAPWIEKIIPG